MRGFIFAIISICVVVFLSGCGSDQYTIEREYWRLQKQSGKIFKNPHASPPAELERVVKQLDSFVRKHPKTGLALEAEFNITRLYMVKEEYDKARAYLKTLLEKHGKLEAISSELVFLTGNSYELEDKWNLALGQYKKIMQEYPTTLRGLNIPVYIALHYKVKYQPDKMIVAFKEAIGHYKTLANKYPNSALSFRADTLVAQCYIQLKDWKRATSSLEAIITDYKGKVNADGVMMDLALLYSRELKDKDKAKEILERLIKDYPKSRLIETAAAILKGMEIK